MRPSIGLQLDEIAHGLLSVFRTFDSASTDSENARDNTTLWPLPIADVYVRGNDLVVTYQAVEAWPYSPQVYSRSALDAVDGVRASMSLIVSMQTQLLDTCPQITVSSQVSSKETLGLVITESGDAEIGPISGGNWEAPDCYDVLHHPPLEQVATKLDRVCILRRLLSRKIAT